MISPYLAFKIPNEVGTDRGIGGNSGTVLLGGLMAWMSQSCPPVSAVRILESYAPRSKGISMILLGSYDLRILDSSRF